MDARLCTGILSCLSICLPVCLSCARAFALDGACSCTGIILFVCPSACLRHGQAKKGRTTQIGGALQGYNGNKQHMALHGRQKQYG
eukprot:1147238-Pelagomonas_calceolata.AAC.7